MIRTLFDEGYLVIAAGGGGVPVARNRIDGTLRGVEAVIDKDHSAAVLARLLGVDILLILTDVDTVFLNFNRPDQEAIGVLSPVDAQACLDAGQFPKGSMGPKIESALRFLASGGKKAIITSPANALEALSGRGGTTIAVQQ